MLRLIGVTADPDGAPALLGARHRVGRRVVVHRQTRSTHRPKGIDRITPDDRAAYMAAKTQGGLSIKTVSNHLNFAHGLFSFAVKRGWARDNPVAVLDRPRVGGPNPDIRYLDPEELEALLRAVPDDDLGETERILYLTATMTGLRQGELVALRWRDVDWTAGVIRVRRNYTRGQWGTPKSRRSSRAVPMADRVAGGLDRHFKASGWQGDDDLAFAHPVLGTVLDASKLRKRFARALERAGVRPVRFHDLRHTFGTRIGCCGRPATFDHGMDGLPRLLYHARLRRFRARPECRRPLRHTRLRRW